MRVRVIEFQSMGLLAELELSQVPVERASLLYDGGRWMVMRVDWCVVGDQLEADLFVGRIMRDERAEVGEEVPGV